MRDPATYIFKNLLFTVGFAVLLLAAGCFRIAPKPEASEPAAPVTRTARLIFIGDVMSHSPQVAAAHAAYLAADTTRIPSQTPAGYDYTEVFRHMRPIFENADVVVANLETTLRAAPPYTGYPTFAAPAELAFAMREAGIDIATVANNHICDKGGRGIRSTLALLDSAGLAHTGAFADSLDRRSRNPLRFTAGGIRFALLNYTYGTNGIPVPDELMVNSIDTALIARDLASVRRNPALASDLTHSTALAADTLCEPVDCIIVSYHWGDEYRRHPSAAQRELAAWTRARGADIIIGSHPHVIQPPEAYYADSEPNAAPACLDSQTVTGATYYSLGNFVSNQRGRYTDGGMTAEITVTKTTPAPASSTVSSRALPTASPPLRFEFAYRLFWVHTPVEGGVRRYTVLPSSVADTLPATDPARFAADQFLRDSRMLLSAADSVFTELRSF